ncbi:dihydroorotate dehydrogenase electron transfer subunit [Candidatus Woesearchaeota archaeon]|nr:dihydroorotate dehydrogenase electron transfer subunit [Candidatus Woesearchaeota archaeon]
MCDDHKTEQPTIVEILNIKDEAKDIKTFYFKYNLDAKPGQFFILWLPGINEKPFGVSYQDEDKFGATICKVGPFTDELFKLKKGDKIGIRGPYGTSFELKGKNIALVAGGYGVAPLSFLADEAIKKGIIVHFIYGAKTKKVLVNCDKKSKKCKVHYTTDDGTYGLKGFTTEKLKEILEKEKIDCIYTVGPEVMMKRVVELSDEFKVDCQLSLERYIKCGFGICGQCVVDDIGIRMCKEGPCIDKKLVKKISEFGKYKRDASGKKVEF